MVPGSEPIVRHVVFLNGRTTGHQTRGLSRERSADGATDAATVTAVTAEQVVAVEPGLNTLSVRAYGASNVFGKSHTLTLRVPEPPEPERPRLFVIAVGVDVYQGDIQDLAYARRDAVSVAMRLDDLPADIYEDVIVVRREDEEATLAGLRSAFAEVGRDIRPIDTVAVYLAGHGVRRDGQYYFVTHDVPGLEQIAERALSQSLLVELLGSLRGANTLLMLDTCHSGAFPANAPGEIGNDTGYFVLAASATEEEALDGYNNRNGVFGHAVLTTLDDDPKTRDGIVTAIDLGLVVPDRVSAFAGEKGYSQSAQFRSGTIIKDFPLAQARP
jgi:hypothetical protein